MSLMVQFAQDSYLVEPMVWQFVFATELELCSSEHSLALCNLHSLVHPRSNKPEAEPQAQLPAGNSTKRKILKRPAPSVEAAEGSLLVMGVLLQKHFSTVELLGFPGLPGDLRGKCLTMPPRCTSCVRVGQE